ncbi:MAG: HAMP domain-containing histidine kinase [Elusimicrobia bacterium]|nr:HAMP domain-containing histidine kinase [Elusimicrobiota bacterium]
MNAAPPPPTHLQLARRFAAFKKEITAVLVADSAALALWYLHGMPFHPRFVWAIWASLLFHALVLTAFELLGPRLEDVLSVFTAVNIAILGAVIHYSGGIVSPFAFLFVSILISRGAYGIPARNEMLVAMAVYAAVVVGEASGVLSVWPLAPAALYSDRAVLALLVLNMFAGILTAGFFYRSIFEGLRARLAGEQAEKQTALERIAELEPKAQRSVVVSRLAHDIQGFLTPLAGVLHEVGRSNGGDGAYMRESAELALRNLSTIKGLTARLVAYSTRRDEKPQRVELWPLLEQVLKTARHLDKARTVDLLLAPTPVHPLAVLGYPEELERVYFNLVKNAVEALHDRPEPREVHVTVASHETQAYVLVRDTGPGMAPELAEALFKGGATTKADGHGLGLTVAREVVAAHNGSLTFDTEPGRGTEFQTRIPLAPPEDA